MKSKITRRDFLNGAALSLGAASLAPRSTLAADILGDPQTLYYPPTLTGLRGSHKGSYEAAHALVMGGQKPSGYQAVDQTYDLVVVGGGISGLAAAYLYRKQVGDQARILILDNHDDFGGHAKRNEFWSDGKMLLGFGGSINLEQYALSPGARGLLEEIGVDFKALAEAVDPRYGLYDFTNPNGLYLNADTFGRDQVLTGQWSGVWSGQGNYQTMINQLELASSDKQKLIELASGEMDYLADIPESERPNLLRTTPYANFLRETVGLSEPASQLFDPFLRAMFGVGGQNISLSQAVIYGAPGAYLLGMPEESYQAEAEGEELAEIDYTSPVFPDGNASVARLLVRKLIPEVAPGQSMEDVVTARFDYSKLDRDSSPVRIRLNSTVVNVTHNGDKAVDVSYVTEGKAYRVRGKHCILAGYNGMIPHLCPELPEAQKEHLAYSVKVPYVWVNVLLRSGQAIHKNGVLDYRCPGSYFELVAHAPPVALGDYSGKTKAGDPMLMFMGHSAAARGDGTQTARDLYRIGRGKLLATTFAEYESEVRKQLTGMFGANGFDADRDIQAITVNRWSHGYAYEYIELYDGNWEEGQAPHELARAQFGRISIANSDSEAYAYVQAAIDAAIRAVDEQLGTA